jgi:capsular polysaccharide biosynthesis protein
MNRKFLNKFINALFPVKSEIIGSPRKRSTVRKYINENPRNGNLEFQYFPDVFSYAIDLPVFFKQHTLFPVHPVFTANLKNARVWGRNGAVLSAGDHFLEDISREFNKGMNIDHSIFYTLKQVNFTYYDLKLAVIGTAGANVYYHWMMDVLPRLGLISKKYSLEEISYFITEFTKLPFQVETLKKARVPVNKIIASNDNWNFHIKCKELIVPSLVSPIDQVSTFQIDYLRALYRDCIKKQVRGKRLYISRNKVGRRTIVNEPELLTFLSSYGFQVEYCEDLSVSQQVALFSSASCIVCSHGSALVNIAFCHPGTTVIDIFNEKHINPCFWFISKINNLYYGYFQGKAVPIDDNYKNDNTRIDITDFKKFFNELLISDKI